jgi:Ni,Fe-hydrogenase maturation factor
MKESNKINKDLYNSRIAKFVKYDGHPNETPDYFDYGYSMPVIDLIQSMGFQFYMQGHSVWIEPLNADEEIVRTFEETLQESIWMAIVEFIVWHEINPDYDTNEM